MPWRSTVKTYPISEITKTWQMEGMTGGLPVVLIRFAGCNLKCSWCDESHKEHDTRHMILGEISSYIPEDGSRHILLTGGEPSIHIDEYFASWLLHSLYLRGVIIETNGTEMLPLLPGCHIVCSPKYPYPVRQTQIDEFKFVVPGDWPNVGAVAKAVEGVLDRIPISFQPQWRPLGGSNVRKTVLWAHEFYELTGIMPRLSIQGHKYIGLR